MNIHDLIESGLPVPRKGAVVRINDNAKNPANHWVIGFVDRYEIHVELTGGRVVRVSSESVDAAESTLSPND